MAASNSEKQSSKSSDGDGSSLSPSERQKSSPASVDGGSSRWKYDVFLSFRGEDTRKKFTDHLYAALIQKGIYTFMDDEKLERGTEISSEIVKAIEESRFSIVIFSKNYASSTWCLEELAKIVECREANNHPVIPVFYHVDPSDVRDQKGEFKRAFDKHQQNLDNNKVQRWRAALKRVSNFSGYDLSYGRPEAQCIKDIVDEKPSPRLQQTSLVGETEVYGRGTDKKKIMDFLLSGKKNILFDRMSPRMNLWEFLQRHEFNEILFKKLETTMRQVNAVLSDAEEKQITNPFVRKWIDEIKDAAYHTTDLLDEIHSLALPESQASNSSALKSVINNSKSELEKMTTKLDNLVKHKDVLGLEASFSGKPSSRLQLTSLVDETEVYGRETDKEKIVNFLISTGKNDQIPAVVAIVGMTGVGKTTLAQLLYNDSKVQNHFDKRAWVYISEDFDVFKVTKTLYESITLKPCDIKDLNILQLQLKEILTSKKFLIVLDDVWNEYYNKWDALRNFLKVGASGSRIVVTTRSQGVASTMRAIHTHHLQPLEDNACWSVFANQAFGSPDARDASPKLTIIGKEIMKKCGGLPLAAKVLGSLLYSKVDVHEWNNILKSNIWDLSNSKSDIWEAQCIKDIVDDISRRLNITFSNFSGDLVGMNSHLNKMNAYLKVESDDVRFIGIWGMGGIGKTTIARAVFEKISYQYEASCFLGNIREGYERSGLVALQEQLLSQVMKQTIHITDVYQGINLIRRWLGSKKVLVVLDDVDDQLEQLTKLAGSQDWFGPKSRIIVTTRDKHLLLNSRVIKYIYEVGGLNHDDALQLFRMKAFKNQYPMDDHVNLSKHIVNYAHGIPLALEVLGSYLCDRTVEQWKSALDSLQDSPDGNFLKVLRLSYDGLKQNEKDIFLHIACFFNGKNKDRVVEILDCCSFCSTIGINVLVDKSLVTISYNKLGIHDLLREMGWEIVREQHCDDRGKWSRLWLYEDVRQVLTDNKSTHAVKSITLNKPKQKMLLLYGNSFSNMSNLRLLKNSNVDVSEDLRYLPNELRFLKWHGCPLKSLPSNFEACNLVELNLCHSQIRYLWKDLKAFPKLKTVKLSYSHNLIETPDFTMVPNLEKLNLESCTKLHKVHDSVRVLKSLTAFNLKGCKNLESFPSNVSGLKLLKILNIRGCSKLDKLPENLGELECLEELDAGETAITQVPHSIARLSNLEYLSFCERKVQSCLLLPSLSGLLSLKILDLSGCNLSEEVFPRDLGSLCSLEELNLSNNNFVNLPESIKQLHKLNILCIQNCARLRSLPDLPAGPIFLGAEDCPLLEDLSSPIRGCTSPDMALLDLFNCLELPQNQNPQDPGASDNSSASSETSSDTDDPINVWYDEESRKKISSPEQESLNVSENSQLKRLPQKLKIEACNALKSLPEELMHDKLQHLDINDCQFLKSIEASLLPKALKSLYIRRCKKLEFLSAEEIMGKHTSIEHLCIESSCDSLKSFPLALFPKLKNLTICDCANFNSISITEDHMSLNSLEIRDCTNLESLWKSGLHTPNLISILLSNCKNLKQLPGQLHELASLQSLFITECPELDSIPEGGLPSSLNLLRISSCHKLTPSLQWGLDKLNNFSRIEIEGGCRDLKSFPEQKLLPMNLNSLQISRFLNLKVLNYEGLQHLTSLQTLKINSCDKLQSLPEEGLPSSLSYLYISDCPMLKSKLQNRRGTEWSKIAHIPHIQIDGKVIS